MLLLLLIIQLRVGRLILRPARGQKSHPSPPVPADCFHPQSSPIHFHFHPHTTSIQSPSVPVNISSIPVPELTAGNRSNIIILMPWTKLAETLTWTAFHQFTVFILFSYEKSSNLLLDDYSKTLQGKMNRHSCGSRESRKIIFPFPQDSHNICFHSRGNSVTLASIPMGIPRSPRDSRHPHSRAGL